MAVPIQPTAVVSQSVHKLLGGGSVADLLLWRNRSASISAFAGATALWVLFDFLDYSAVSLAATSLFLLSAIVFLWAKAAALLNRPLPPVPNLEISEEAVEKAVVRARVWIDFALSLARDIAIERDQKAFLQVILSLWVVSYIGSFFNFVTVVYIWIVLLFTVPVLYVKYPDHVDDQLGLVLMLFSSHYNGIVSRTAEQAMKGKKTQ